MANRPTVAWDETSPPGSQSRTLGDNRIREMKTQIREIFEEDHIFESSGQDTDWGYHKKCQFLEQASDPANVANSVILYAKQETVKNKAALYFQDEDGTVKQWTEEGNFIAGIAGEIRMWSGSIATIQTGWYFCNGANSTPDLRNRFIVAANADDAGVAKSTIAGAAAASGGATTHTHAAGSYAGPSHTHTGPIHTHSVNITSDNPTYPGGSTSGLVADNDSMQSNHTHFVSGNTGAEGTGATGAAGTGAVTGTSGASSVTELPTWYALAFIMKA